MDIVQKSRAVNAARSLKYDWPFVNMNEKLILTTHSFNQSILPEIVL